MTADAKEEPPFTDDSIPADDPIEESSELDSGTADSSTPSEGAEDNSETTDELTQLTEQNVFLLDQVQRARAELANVRRRTADQRVEMRDRMVVDHVRQFLPVYDDLTNALGAHGEAHGEAPLAAGLKLIVDKFDSILVQLGVERVPGVGEPFDPTWHEALLQCESQDFSPGMVVQEFEVGYRLGQELVRAARVSVAKEPESSE